MMPFQFKFMGFNPDLTVRSAAQRTLDQILNQSPYESHPVALLERSAAPSQDHYHCAVEIYTRFGPFMASAEKSTALEALAAVEQALLRKLRTWAESRSRVLRVGSRELQSA